MNPLAMFPLRTWIAIGGAVALSALLAFGVHHERQIGRDEIQAQWDADKARLKAAADAEAARSKELAAQLIAARAERKVRYATIVQEVDRIVERPVYRNECIDDDGLRGINAALAGAPAAFARVDAAMPAASAASR